MIEFAVLPVKGFLVAQVLVSIVLMFVGMALVSFLNSWEEKFRTDSESKGRAFPFLKFLLGYVLSLVFIAGCVFFGLSGGQQYTDLKNPISASEFISLRDEAEVMPKVSQVVFRERFNRYLVTDGMISKVELKVLTEFVLETNRKNLTSASIKQGERALVEMSIGL